MKHQDVAHPVSDDEEEEEEEENKGTSARTRRLLTPFTKKSTTPAKPTPKARSGHVIVVRGNN